MISERGMISRADAKRLADRNLAAWGLTVENWAIMTGKLRKDARFFSSPGLVEMYGPDRAKALGLLRADGSAMDGRRRSDTQTATFQQVLTHVIREKFNQQFPNLDALTTLPEPSEYIEPGAQKVRIQGYQIAGHSARNARTANDVPRISLRANEEDIPVTEFDEGWVLTIGDLEATQMSGNDLNAQGLEGCLLILRTDEDRELWYGSPIDGTVGFADLPTKTGAIRPTLPATGAGVELFAAGAPAGFTGAWTNPATTSANIRDDVANMIAAVSWETPWVPRILEVPHTIMMQLQSRKATGFTDTSLATDIERSFNLQIRKHMRLDTDRTGATRLRVILWQPDRQICQPMISLQPSFNPTSFDGLAYLTISRCRTAGVAAPNSTGMVYANV